MKIFLVFYFLFSAYISNAQIRIFWPQANSMGMLPMRETDPAQSELRKEMDESRKKGERETCGLFEGSCGFVYDVCLSQNAINNTK